MGLEEADREEERLRAGASRMQRHGGRRDVVHACVVSRVADEVVAEVARVGARRAAPPPSRSSSPRRAACGAGAGRGSSSAKPRCASPIIPLQCGHRPVSSAARLRRADGAALNAWRNSSPWSASRWMFGVGDLVAVRLDVAAGVVRVQVDDVGRLRVHSRSGKCSLMVCRDQRGGYPLPRPRQYLGRTADRSPTRSSCERP